MLEPQLVLASMSAARATMLRTAGVRIEALPAHIDEDSIRDALLGEGAKPRDIADALAEAKALKISRKLGPALVLGSDQLLVTAYGEVLSKPESMEQACDQLRRLSGARHDLVVAAVIASNGTPIWRFVDTVQMMMRPLSEEFISQYVTREWEHIRHCVGCYQIEGAGAQLFAQIKGSHFSIMGLPLLAVLDYLRVRGVLAS
jgi:septum formation protein